MLKRETVGESGEFKESTRNPCSRVKPHLEHTRPDGQEVSSLFTLLRPISTQLLWQN